MEITIQDLRDAIAELEIHKNELLKTRAICVVSSRVVGKKENDEYMGKIQSRVQSVNIAIAVIEREIKAIGEAGDE